MRLTENGVSTTREAGIFAYEEFGTPDSPKVQWDYRARNGQLFSGVAKTLAAAIITAERDSNEKVDKNRMRKCS